MNNFDRRIRVEYNDLVKTYPELDMNFYIEFNTDSNGNKCDLTMYNLNNDSISQLEIGTQVKVFAGYKDNTGLIFIGKVSKVETKIEGLDRKTEIQLIDSIQDLINTVIAFGYAKNTKASYIIADMINKSGIGIGFLKITNDFRYESGKVFVNTLKEIFEELAKETNSKFHVSKNLIYFSPENETNSIKISLDKNTGLISSPQTIGSEDGERYKVQCLLRYEIEPDTILGITSKTINGDFRVISGIHTEDFNTECVVEKL